MKKAVKLLSIFVAVITSLPVFGQKNNPDNKSLLWRINGKGLTTTSYLFGTIHLICPDDYFWTDKMKESLAKSDKVCFEMDLDDPSVMMQVAAGMIDNSGKKLQDYFTPEQYKLLKNYVKDSLGMDIAMIEAMKPVMLESIISTGSAECPNPISYEDTIMKTAQQDKKEILGLETPAEQLEVLAGIPTDSVVKDLMDDLLNHNTSTDTEYTQLIAAYKKQDLPALYAILLNSKDMGEDLGSFLDDRNKKWIARMADKMQHSSVFFAVGAGHLWGDNGVISLLRKNGYKVAPVK